MTSAGTTTVGIVLDAGFVAQGFGVAPLARARHARAISAVLRGIGTVLEKTVHGGHEVNRLVSFRRP